MSKSTRKIIAGLLTFAMVLTMVVGLTAAPAGAQTVSFTRNLTVGSRGADVTALQTILVTKGFLTAEPTGYFGTLTKRAVAAWQASEGITPAAGYFGAKSRAAIGTTGAVSTVPGCTAGAAFSSTTGAPCTTGSTVPGCTPGALFSSTTGASCASGVTPSTSTTEGTLQISQAPGVTSNANITSNTDVPVWGLQLRASLGDVTVNRLDLDVKVETTAFGSGSVTNPGNFVNTIKVTDGTNVVKTFSVGTADFVTGANSNDYYVRLPNLGFTVAKDQTRNLVVTFSTSGGIDVSRYVTVIGYGSNPIAATSGGVVGYYSNTTSFQQTFKQPGNASLSLGLDGSNPVSTSYYVDPSSGTQGATMLAWNAYSTTGDSKITEVNVTLATTTASATLPSTLYLYDGSTLLASRAATAGTVTFSNFPSTIVANGTTKVYTIKADMPSTVTNGSGLRVSLATVVYQTPNGNSSTATASGVTGNVQTFTGAAANLAFVSSSKDITTGANGVTDSYTGTIVMTVRPQGGSMVTPISTDFKVYAATTTAASANGYAITGANLTIGSITQGSTDVSSQSTLSQNTTYTITLNAKVASSTLAAGFYNFYLTSASTTVAGVQQTITTGLDAFKTPQFAK